jgi:hypothetical protein
MPINFPASLDSFANPTAGSYEDDTGLEHHTQHANANDAAEALEAKLGIGASTPAANTILGGNGTGTSGWRQVVNGDIANAAISQSGVAAATGGQTTTSTTPVDVTGASVTFTTTGGRVLLLFSGYCSNGAANQTCYFSLVQDGATAGQFAAATSATASAIGTVSMVMILSPSAGSHTWKVQWSVTGNTSTLSGGYLSVMEIKK